MKKITVVTITRNNVHLNRTLQSILDQTISPQDIEHIIVDGLSKDNTKEIVKKYMAKAPYKVIYIREKDNGRYEAMNKGIKIARGKYLSFLNAGDHFFANDSLSSLLSFSKNNDIVFGNVNVIYDENHSSIYSPPDKVNFKYFLSYALPHQASIIKKKLFSEIGLYDESFKISGDHKFFMLAICKYKKSYLHLNKTISTYYFDGISSQITSRKIIEIEKRRIYDENFSTIVEYKNKIKKINKKEGYDVPVLLIIFNRPDKTRKIINSLRNVKPKFLYVAADGPREDNIKDKFLCYKTRKEIKNIDWDCDIKMFFRNTNFGCGNGVSKFIDWFFTYVKEGIILEDDCIPSKSFFSFMKAMLTKYRNDTRISHINGTSFVNLQKEETYYFLKYYHVWGWATWARAWNFYDFDMKTYVEFKKNNIISNIFTNKKIQDFWITNFDNVYQKKVDTWDYQWVYANFLNNTLSIMPFVNLIKNIGYGKDAVHTKNAKDKNANREIGELMNLKHPEFLFHQQKLDDIIYTSSLDLDLRENLDPITNNFLQNSKITLKKRFDEKITQLIGKNAPFLGIANQKLFSKIIILLIIAVIWFTSIFGISRFNLRYPSFWYDESGQFWISKGLNHFSKPFSATGGIYQVIQNNIRFNLDPGGFSIILHYWSFISNNHTFLRLLPFTFFILGAILVSKIMFFWSKKNIFNYFGGLILFSSPLLAQYAFELRPYSMEMFATLAFLYFSYRSDYILIGKKHALLSGAIVALLITSRYSSFFGLLAMFSVIFFTWLTKYKSLKSFVNIFIFSLPVTISIYLIYSCVLRFQNYGIEAPFYVTKLMFKYNNVKNLLFNTSALITLLPFCLILLVKIISYFDKKLENIISVFNIYIYFVFLLNLPIIFLSIIGKYPWTLITRWDISTNVIFFIGWIPLILIFTDFLKEYSLILFHASRLLLLMLFILFIFKSSYSFIYSPLDTIYVNFINNYVKPDSKILINVSADPSFRYLFEYGPLRNNKNLQTYKHFSMFDNEGYHDNSSIKNSANINDFDYIILSNMDYDHSQIKKVIQSNPNWKDITVQGPSKMFKNTTPL